MKSIISRSILLFFLVLTAWCGWVFSEEKPYDPSRIAKDLKIDIVDTTVKDPDRDREIPIRIFLPPGKNPGPVVLFSHGLGGSCKMNAFMGEHWAARGFFTVFIQHPGSDVSVWQAIPLEERMNVLAKAANLQTFQDRVKDVSFVLDELGKDNENPESPYFKRMNIKHVGMSGHSFGAVTTQAVSGQRTILGEASFTDPRITAAMMFSPSKPKRGSPEKAFGQVEIPWMIMTGTKDVSSIGEGDMESRLAVYPALPPGGKYELVLFNAEHSAFTDRALPGDSEQRNPNHHRVILALSTAFWDAYLMENAAAKKWLDGNGPQTVLEKEDRWQKK
jgi:predicted dienelactone hydrolase